MDVLSAATETVANADAIAAAAATLSVAAASSVASSPRASSPTNSTSTRDGAGGGGAVSRPDGSEMDEEDTPSMRSRESSSAMATVVPVAATVPVAGISPAIREAHAKLEAQAEDIRNGKHPKLVADMVVQGGLKRSRMESAKETSQLLNSNIDGLRQAVARDSDVQTKVALERTQEELLDDVHQRIRKARVDGGLAPCKEAPRGIATRAEGEAEGEGDKGAAAITLPGKKRARLMPARSFEKVTPEAVLAKAEARRIRTVTLSDIEMRRDFREIITDWRERATKYLSTYNNSHWTKVNVSSDSFRVRGVTFTKGDPVVVTSRVTGEEFHGEITVVKPKAVFLSLYGGVKTRIFVDHISTGRLTVARSDSKSIQ